MMTTKPVRNVREPLKKPRPLKSSSLEQPKDIKEVLQPKAKADLLSELEILNVRISNCDLEDVVTCDISQMCSILKKHGEELDLAHKDALDRYFCSLRNACREDRLDVLSRLKLLEIIEMRAMHWKMNENLSNYFNSRYLQLEEAGEQRPSLSGSVSPTALASLSPGEFLRSSGKFSKPTKIAGKNYFKDEIVIRNCDSGKVMGIKGRRVHMIEELSDTVISFQRVNAGARDRLVQITGPHEEAIGHAKYLVEDTIKRNVSPVRDNMNESSLDNKDSIDYVFDRKRVQHSLSMNDAREMCSVTVQVGPDVLTLSGVKPDLLKTAKNVLIEYFSGRYEEPAKDTVLPLMRSISSGNTSQRFPLKKQVSLKDNLGVSSFPSPDQAFSRRSSSSASWSSDEIPEKESSDFEPAIIPPIPPPSYPMRQVYSREFLMECANHPLSKKQPPDFEKYTALYPEIKRRGSNSPRESCEAN